MGDGYITIPAHIEILAEGETNKFFVTIYEGKFHQIKRMFKILGMRVSYLKRVEINGIELDKDLEIGAYRELTETEIYKLKSKN